MPLPKPGKRTRYNRAWTDEEKIAILDDVDQAMRFGNKGEQAEILRKHNINTAYLAVWKKTLKAKGVLPERLWRRK